MGRPTGRTFTEQQTYEIVMQLLRGEKQLTSLAREHGVDHTTIDRWRDQMQAAAIEAFDGKRQPPEQAAETRIRELEAGGGAQDA